MTCPHLADQLLGGTQVCAYMACAKAWLVDATNYWGGIGRVTLARAREQDLVDDLVAHVQERALDMVLPYDRQRLGRVVWFWARRTMDCYRAEVVVSDDLWQLLVQSVVELRGACMVSAWYHVTHCEARQERRYLTKQVNQCISMLWGPEWAIYLADGFDEVDLMLLHGTTCRWVEERGEEIAEAISEWA